VSLAVLSVCSDFWRRLLVGPLVAGTALAATATVTVGWHRPSDVLAGLILALAWHRALSAGLPAERRLRTMLPGPVVVMTGLWWAGACFLVLGVGLDGVRSSLHFGEQAPLVYAGSLAVLLAGTLATIVLGAAPGRPEGVIDAESYGR
jgi:hypothetical protein